MYLPGTYHYNTYINEWSCHAVRAVRRYIKNGFISDLFFYVVGRLNENELVLLSVLNCLFDSINNVSKEVIKYKRKDGVELSGTLYLPEGYDKIKKAKNLI